MIAVDGGKHLAALTGFPLEPVTLSPYFIDRTEVTNAAFKEFVDAGGHVSRGARQQAFRQGDRVLDWKQAMALFVDTTGRPGPAGWELGRYAPGHEDYPVGGVSWFEAAAYAAFRGKELPTRYHWIRRGAAQRRAHALDGAGDRADEQLRGNRSGAGRVVSRHRRVRSGGSGGQSARMVLERVSRRSSRARRSVERSGLRVHIPCAAAFDRCSSTGSA